MFGKKKTAGRHSAEYVNKEKKERADIPESVPGTDPSRGPEPAPLIDPAPPAEEKEKKVPVKADKAGETSPVPVNAENASAPAEEPEKTEETEKAVTPVQPDLPAGEPEGKEADAGTALKTGADDTADGETQKEEEKPEVKPAGPVREKAEREPEGKAPAEAGEAPAPGTPAETSNSAKPEAAAETPAKKPQGTAVAAPESKTPAQKKAGGSGKAEKTGGKMKATGGRKTEKTSGKSIPSIPSLLICALLIAAIVFVLLMILKLNVLPLNLVIAAGLILAGLAFICVALTWSTKKPVRFAVGVFFTTILLAGLVIGSFAMKKAWDTAQKVTASSVTMAEVGVYVNADDEATTIADLGGYTFGVLKTQDRDDANKALMDIASDLNLTIYVAEYDNVIKLISALYKHQVQAAVVETYHIEMLGSMEDSEYTEIAELVRLVGQYEVESSSPEVTTDFGDIDDSPLKKEEATPVEQGYEDHTFCIYVSGIDSFGAVNVKSRSDVNVLAFINDKTHQIFLVSTPRDYYVRTTVSGDQRDKLTHAGLYGPECSMGTLANLYDCDVDYYFRINFSGFVDVVNALGGMDVEIWEGYPKVHLDGEDALLIARDRHSIGGETNRGDRHMSMISAVIDQVLSTDILYNYNDVLDAVSDSFDTSVPYELISRIVKEQIQTNPSWEIIKYKVTGYGGSDFCFSLSMYDATGGQAYVMYPNYDTVQIVHDIVRAMERNERITAPNAEQ